MNRLVGEVHQKRSVPLPLDEPDGPVGEDIRDVAVDLMQPPVLVQLGIDRAPLPRHPDPVVEPRSRRRVVVHVPFTQEGGLVPDRVERTGKSLEPMARVVAGHVVDDPVSRGILARQEACPVGRAQGDGVERVREQRTFTGQTVDVGGFEIRVAGGAELVPAEVVHDDNHEVGASREGGGPLLGRPVAPA